MGAEESINWGIFFKAAYSEPDFYPKSHIREIGGMMRDIMRKGIVTLMGVGTVVLAQGVTFPTTPTQTPINGMGLLAVFGAVLLYKTFTKK